MAKISGTTFAMTHKMGLAKITLASKAVTLKVTWNFTAPQTAHTAYTETKTSGTTGSVTASSSFNSATAARLCNSSGYWTIVKATGASTSAAVTLGTNTNVADDWSQSVSGIGYGKYVNYNVTSSRTFQQFEAIFPYNSSKTYYQITLPWYGSFKLEVWGASGTTDYGKPGIGGYTYGTYRLNKTGDSRVLYVCVGGAGTHGSDVTISTAYAGYNGGGYGQEGGGGATHIAQTLVGTGVLSAYSSSANQNNVLVVAGGAGNADLGTGGNGGGGNNNGQDGSLTSPAGQPAASGNGGGGTQTSGGVGYGNTSPGNGSFGQGGSYGGAGDGTAAGGGGWYGGGCSTYPGNGPGGGGSGHINTNKIMSPYGGTTGGGTLYANGSAKISM